MKIFYRLMYSNPQALVNLDNYQRRRYGCSIKTPEQEVIPVFDYPGEALEVVDREMRKPSYRPVRVK